MGKVFMKINIGQYLYTVILTSPMVANHVDIPERENVTPRKRGYQQTYLSRFFESPAEYFIFGT